MNKHIALLALSLGACSGDPRLERCDTQLERCEEQLRWVTTAWEECSSQSREGSPFGGVRAQECRALQELITNSTDKARIAAILDGCAPLIVAQKRADEERARRVRADQRKAYCEGEDVPLPE